MDMVPARHARVKDVEEEAIQDHSDETPSVPGRL